MTPTATYESYISGPRWRLPEGTIRKGIMDTGLNVHLDYEQRVTSLTRATVFFRIYGAEDQVRAFRECLYEAVDNVI